MQSSRHLAWVLLAALPSMAWAQNRTGTSDVIAGQIHGLYTTTISADAFIRSGRAKVLGVAGPKRQAVIPNAPTLAEQGIQGADNLLWIGLVTTAKVPRAIIDQLNREVNRVLRMPDVKQRFEQLGLDIEGGTPEHFGKFIKSQADANDRTHPHGRAATRLTEGEPVMRAAASVLL